MAYEPELNDVYVDTLGQLWYVKEILEYDPWKPGIVRKGYWLADPYQYKTDRYLDYETFDQWLKLKQLKLAWTAEQVKKERNMK